MPPEKDSESEGAKFVPSPATPAIPSAKEPETMDRRRNIPIYPYVTAQIYNMLREESRQTGVSSSSIVFILLDAVRDIKRTYAIPIRDIVKALYKAFPDAKRFKV